jgi:Uma2 family endonuclease
MLRSTKMTEPAKRRATYDDLAALPPNVVGELIHGVLHVQPRPAPRHARAASSIGGALVGPLDRGVGGPGGWIILDEPELHLDADILVPDVAAWRRERMPELPDAAAFELAPDWICEVLSPLTAAKDRADKMPLYAERGVGHAWLVDPLTRTLEVYRREGSRWLLLITHRDDAPARIEPFEAIEFPVAWLWAT